jgi:hypothetical protein
VGDRVKVTMMKMTTKTKAIQRRRRTTRAKAETEGAAVVETTATWTMR